MEVPATAAAGGEPGGDDGPSDGELVRRARAGERAAFGVLVDRYQGMVAALTRQRVQAPADAEDVVQESFLKAYARLPSLKEADSFGPWLYGIAFRAAVDHLRRRGRSGRVRSLDAVREDGGVEPIAEGEDGAERAVRAEQAERVLEALGALPERYRVVLTLRYQRQMSYQEIADHLGEPGGTIANRLHRAIALLRARLHVEASP